VFFRKFSAFSDGKLIKPCPYLFFYVLWRLKVMQDKILKESEAVELKKSTSELKEAIISIAAILNKHKKGELYFGLKNDGTCVGQHFMVIFKRTPQDTPRAELTPLERNILKSIRDNPRISRKQLADTLEISPETVKEYLEKLKSKKTIRRIGKTSSGYWEIL
jgi:predicted HTH transcriptional regulator